MKYHILTLSLTLSMGEVVSHLLAFEVVNCPLQKITQPSLTLSLGKDCQIFHGFVTFYFLSAAQG